MIIDAQGRKWAMRFKQYSNGWHWTARWQNHGLEPDKTFQTKALAEADAQRAITSCDHIAQGAEFFRRLSLRGSECRLTVADRNAIEYAGKNKKRTPSVKPNNLKCQSL